MGFVLELSHDGVDIPRGGTAYFHLVIQRCGVCTARHASCFCFVVVWQDEKKVIPRISKFDQRVVLFIRSISTA